MTPGGRPRKDCRSDFEANLLALMAEAGISDYAALARAAGVTPVTIQRICFPPGSKSYRRASVDTLVKLSQALNCKVDDLITNEP